MSTDPGDVVRATIETRDLVAAESPMSERASPALPVERLEALDDGEPEVRDSPFGRLELRAVDASSSNPIAGIHARVLSPSYFAERRAGDDKRELAFALTPDAYALFVTAPGYEPVELPPIAVARGAITAIEPIRLRRGVASIRGVVRDARAATGPLLAELIGYGRGNCASCAPSADPDGPLAWTGSARCPECGYAAASTRSLVVGGGTFAFDRLASGRYAVRLVDAERREVGRPVEVDLHEAQSAFVELALETARTLTVEILDADGASIADEWAARRAASRLRSMPLATDALAWTGEILAGAERIASCRFAPPSPTGSTRSRNVDLPVGRCGGVSRSDDRPRVESDVLRPAPFEPQIPAPRIAVTVDSSGHLRFDGVPPRASRLEISSGPFAGNVDLGEATELQIRLRPSTTRVASDRSSVPATFLAYERESSES